MNLFIISFIHQKILIAAMSHMHEKYNITGCAVAGDALAGVKMQGGTISWNCDTDFQSFHSDREKLFKYVYPGKIENRLIIFLPNFLMYESKI